MKTAPEPGQSIMKKTYGRETNSGMSVIFLAKGGVSLYTRIRETKKNSDENFQHYFQLPLCYRYTIVQGKGIVFAIMIVV